MNESEAFAFFNDLSGKLEIRLSEPTERIGNLDNEKAPPSAEILEVNLNVQVYVEDSKPPFRPVTEEELATVAYRQPSITLRGESDTTHTVQAPNGEFFTVAELIAAVEETERKTRGESEWFGGVDVHHAYFEGLEQEDETVWQICWGS